MREPPPQTEKIQAKAIEASTERSGVVEAAALAERIRAGLADMAEVSAETTRAWASVDAQAWPAA